MNFNKTLIGAILGLVSGLRGFADWPMQGHDPAQTNCQREGLGGMDSVPYLKWSWTHPYAYGAFLPAVGDLDGDSSNDIAVIFGEYGYCDTFVYAFRGSDGFMLWKSRMPYCVSERTGPAIGDVDGDGRNEVIASTGNGYTVALNGEDGSILWSTHYSHGAPQSPLLLDADGTGDLEILLARGTGGWITRIELLHGYDGSVIWSDTFRFVCGGGPTILPFAVGNMGGDDGLEVVCAANDLITGAPILIIYDAATGNQLCNNPRDIYQEDLLASPTLADLDGDGYSEIILHWMSWGGGWTTGWASAYKWIPSQETLASQKQIFLLWSCECAGGDYLVASNIAAGYLNEDSVMDVLVGSGVGGYYTSILNGQTGELLGMVPGHPKIGNVKPNPKLEFVTLEYGLRAYEFPDSLLWQSSHGVEVGLVIADIDNDGHNEIILGGYGPSITILDGSGMDAPDNPEMAGGEPPMVIYKQGQSWLLFPSGAPENTFVKIYDVRGALVESLEPTPGQRWCRILALGFGLLFVITETPSGVYKNKVLLP